MREMSVFYINTKRACSVQYVQQLNEKQAGQGRVRKVLCRDSDVILSQLSPKMLHV